MAFRVSVDHPAAAASPERLGMTVSLDPRDLLGLWARLEVRVPRVLRERRARTPTHNRWSDRQDCGVSAVSPVSSVSKDRREKMDFQALWVGPGDPEERVTWAYLARTDCLAWTECRDPPASRETRETA
jgi:hypothetical protein